jgi:hypothetical protein
VRAAPPLDALTTGRFINWYGSAHLAARPASSTLSFAPGSCAMARHRGIMSVSWIMQPIPSSSAGSAAATCSFIGCCWSGLRHATSSLGLASSKLPVRTQRCDLTGIFLLACQRGIGWPASRSLRPRRSSWNLVVASGRERSLIGDHQWDAFHYSGVPLRTSRSRLSQQSVCKRATLSFASLCMLAQSFRLRDSVTISGNGVRRIGRCSAGSTRGCG